MAQTDAAAHQLPAGIGTAPGLAPHHLGDRFGVRDAGVKSDLAGYAAHGAPVFNSDFSVMALC
jgi:hypothetical protein